jgi:thiazole synthase ThiGH ThiG subunit
VRLSQFGHAARPCHVTLLWLLPDAVLPLVMAGLGVLVIVGVLSFRRAIAIVLGLALLPVIIDALVGAAFDALPLWMLLLAVAVLALFAIRQAGEFVLGEHATGHVMGHFAIHAIAGIGRLLLLPFQMAGWLLTRVLR